ncbi:hypothetical protein OH492_12460 [Vibrio chagasii]|nr:hypothetical protein [Vibrio chagasii]
MIKVRQYRSFLVTASGNVRCKQSRVFMVENQLAKDGLAAPAVIDRGSARSSRHNGLSLYHFFDVMLLVFEGKIGGKAACNGTNIAAGLRRVLPGHWPWESCWVTRSQRTHNCNNGYLLQFYPSDHSKFGGRSLSRQL